MSLLEQSLTTLARNILAINNENENVCSLHLINKSNNDTLTEVVIGMMMAFAIPVMLVDFSDERADIIAALYKDMDSKILIQLV